MIAMMIGCRKMLRPILTRICAKFVLSVLPSAIIIGTNANSIAFSKLKIRAVGTAAADPNAASVRPGAM